MLGSPSRRVCKWLGLAALVCLHGAPAVAQTKAPGISISHVETFDVASLSGAAFKTSAPGLAFNAYGRRFDLQLEANDRIASPDMLAKAGSLQLLRGSMKNTPGSWVRLASVDGALRGMIWDGSQLYLVESAAAVRDLLAPPLTVKAGETVIFRMADTLIEAGSMSCDTQSSPAPLPGQKAYSALLQELKSSSLGQQAASGPTRRLQISTIGDALFRNQYASADKATEEILIRINNVDGIFSSQVGVSIQAASVNVTDAITQNLSASTDTDALLTSLANLRNSNAELNSRGLTHLFTGRDIGKSGDNSPVGVARTAVLCDKLNGIGMTEARRVGTFFESLVAAHEIGHNFGAIHDGDAGDQNSPSAAACPAGPNLMSPVINTNSDEFSQCSLSAMQPRIQAASQGANACIVALPPADLALNKDLGTLHQSPGAVFTVLIPVTNIGGLTAAAGAQVQIVVPPSLSIESSFVPGGTCISGAGTIACTLDPVPGGTTQKIELELRGMTVGTNSISAQLTAPGDAQTSNNSGDGTIVIDPQVDLSLTLQGPATGVTNTSFATSFTLSNVGTSASGAATVEFTLPAGAAATTASINGTACTVTGTPVRCTVSSVAAKGQITGSIALTPAVSGSIRLMARVTGVAGDANVANDTSEVTVAVRDPTPVRKKGGGGESGELLLLALASVALLRYRSSQRLG